MKLLLDINVTKNIDIDYRMFTFLVDHKTVMKDRVTYLVKNHYLPQDDLFIEEAQENLIRATQCLNLYIKYSLNKKKIEIQNTLHCLNKLKYSDLIFTDQLINTLNYQQHI